MKRQALLVADLGFGDSGKGTIVDYLVRRHEADLVVRFNGGPQAGHNVVLPDGRHHTFSQFGSGSFVPGVRTLLSRFMLIEPYAMLNEAAHLESLSVADCLDRTLIDDRCLVITPPQQIANRIRERARGGDAHGTCGLGVGETVADSLNRPDLALRAADLRDSSTSRRKLQEIRELKREELAPLLDFAKHDERQVLDDRSWIETALSIYKDIVERAAIVAAEHADRTIRNASVNVFEGAQGVLLDERYGFHPHTTWSTTTFDNALALLHESGHEGPRQRIGVLRTYLTRHGPGPFPTASEDLRNKLPEPHNTEDGCQGPFRRGVLDLVMLRYAIRACGNVDALAVTHLDRLPLLPALACDGYVITGERFRALPVGECGPTDDRDSLERRLFAAEPQYRPFPVDGIQHFVDALERALGSEVLYFSTGPTCEDKQVSACAHRNESI